MTETRGTLSRAQMIRLLQAVRPDRIEKKQGLSYVPQQEVRAELSRIFGMGNWESRVIEKEMIYETKIMPGDDQYPASAKSGKPYWVACYRAGVELTVRNYRGEHVSTNLEYHVEENAPLPNRGEAHAMALTSAVSYALRRSAINLGDAFGLHLYDKGNQNPIIRGTFVLTDPDSPLYVDPKPQTQTPPAGDAAANGALSDTKGDDSPASPAGGTSALAAGFAHPQARQEGSAA